MIPYSLVGQPSFYQDDQFFLETQLLKIYPLTEHSHGNVQIVQCLLNVVFPGSFSSAEDFDIYMEKESDHPGYFCTICNSFRRRCRTDVRNHVESKHFPGTFSYNCADCGLILATNTSLKRHQQRVHSSHNTLLS